MFGFEKDKVVLVTPEPKEISVRTKELSLADRAHLVEYAEADPKIITDVELEVPEEEAKIDSKTFIKHKEKMTFDKASIAIFDHLETEHFHIATAGVRPKDVAEMAERLWHGMAFQHMNFREDWGDKKKIIFVIDDDDIYKAMGDWYIKELKSGGEAEQAQGARLERLWMQVSGTNIRLPDEQQEKYNAFSSAKVFRVQQGNDSDYQKVFGPFPTHGIAGALLSQQMGGVSDISPDGYFAITTGHSYYKEIQLAKRTNTHLLDADNYENDEIGKASGFDDGRSWARELRKIVRKGDAELDLQKTLASKVLTVTPTQLVIVYSLSYYMQSTPARLANFAELVRRIESNNQVPPPVEIAKIFGFDSVEDFEEGWTEFVKSTAFK